MYIFEIFAAFCKRMHSGPEVLNTTTKQQPETPKERNGKSLITTENYI